MPQQLILHNSRQDNEGYSCAGMFSYEGISSFSFEFLYCLRNTESREAGAGRGSLLSSNALFLFSVYVPALKWLTSAGGPHEAE